MQIIPLRFDCYGIQFRYKGKSTKEVKFFALKINISPFVIGQE